MAYDFFSADLHFNHTAIINLCNRPFKNAEHMNNMLISNINERCKTKDTLYHLGDLCFNVKADGSGGKHPSEHEQAMDCKLINIKGNHDKSGKVHTALEYVIFRFGKFAVFASHKPPWDTVWSDIVADFYLCGHIHDRWKFNKHNGKLVINVGCDVWNYRPVRKDELLSCYEKFKRGTLELK